MVTDTLTRWRALAILREAGLGDRWDLSETMGTMQATRIARQHDRAVVIKLIRTSAAIMQRLSDLEVTPKVIALGDHDGTPYLIQEAVDGPHPDHAWFHNNRRQWAEMINRYLNDSALSRLLAAEPPFWRLDVAAAAALIDRDLERAPPTPALGSAHFRSAYDSWRNSAASLPAATLRPIHPDPHWHNYLISDGEPLLLDWDHIDLSDPVRDVGCQVWGFLPEQHWDEVLLRVGLAVDATSHSLICWWAAFKMLGNALFNARRGNAEGVDSHLAMFAIAADNTPWLPRPS